MVYLALLETRRVLTFFLNAEMLHAFCLCSGDGGSGDYKIPEDCFHNCEYLVELFKKYFLISYLVNANKLTKKKKKKISAQLCDLWLLEAVGVYH